MDLSIMEAIIDIKQKINEPFSMDIIILDAWSIWIVRNNKFFNNVRPSLDSWKAILKQELRWLQYRMKNKFLPRYLEWLSLFDL
jgi:hypothetical protein